jgi:hypothetical protein
MRYTVIWTRAALSQLTALWTAAPDRQVVTDAVNELDRILRDDPDRVAIPFGRFYSYVEDPITILFEVDPGDCMVRVLYVRRSIP